MVNFMDLMFTAVVTILQTISNSNCCFDNGGIGQILIFSIMLGTFLTIKKMSDSEQRPEIFQDESLYFAREEISHQFSKFEWAPIRKQKMGKSFEDIDVFKHLNKLLKETENIFVVISGGGGIGKTKMLYEFAKETKKNRTVFARWNLPNTSVEQIIDEYKELPNTTKYILLDDVYRNPKKAVQFCISLMPVKTQFVLAARDGDELMDIMKDFQLRAEYFKLEAMKNINDLLEFSTEPWINSDIKAKLTSIARGNPEVLSIGHEFIDQQSQDNLRFDANEFLENIKDKKSLFDSISNYFLENLGRAALAVISRAVIFNGLNRNDSFCKTNFKSYTKLRSLNYFYVQDDRLFFKPNILGEYITNEYYFFKEKIAAAFSNLLQDGSEEDFRCVLSTLIDFYRQQKLPIYKEAASYLLSKAKNKGLSDNTIVNLLLRCDEELKDPKIIIDAIKDLKALNIETTEIDLINRFAIFCAKNKAYECAAKWWETLLDRARLQNNDSLITALYNNLGLVFYNLKNLDEATEWYRLAHDKFEAMGNSYGIIQSLNNLAQIYQKRGDWQRSIELYKKSIDELKKNENTKRAARAYAMIAQIYKSNNELDNAFDNYSQAMEYYEKSDDVDGLSQVYGNLGIISNGRKEWDEAANYFQKTLECMEQIGNVAGIARTHNNLALVFQEKGNIENAIKYFQLAIEKLRFINDTKSLAQAYNNLAMIYQKNEKLEEAMEFYQRALYEFEKLDNNKAISVTLNNLGLIQQEKGELEQAIDCFKRSIVFKGKTGALKGIEHIYGNLGIALQSLKEYDEAITAYEQAISGMDRNGNLQGLAQTYSNLGFIYYYLKDYKEALKLLNQTLFFFLKQESTEDIKKVSGILANIQKEMDVYEFGKFADAALKDVVKNGIQWRSHAVLSVYDAQGILKIMQKRKKMRLAQAEEMSGEDNVELIR